MNSQFLIYLEREREVEECVWNICVRHTCISYLFSHKSLETVTSQQ